MRIIILGANLVGIALAKLLSDEGHDIVMIDESRRAIAGVEGYMDIKCVVGRPSYPDVLELAEIPVADMIVAVTDNDEVNMVACQVAHSLFATKYKIARVHSPHYHVRDDLYGDMDLPINIFINPERLVSRAIRELIRYNGATEVLSFVSKSITVCSLKVPNDYVYSPTIIFPEVGQLYAQYHDSWRPITPEALMSGQSLILVTYADHTSAWLEAVLGHQGEANNIMIMGANKITEQILHHMDHSYNIRVVDQNRQKANSLAEKFSKATVLHGDPADCWFLQQESISSIDIFIALSDDDEDNLIACLQAKSMGAKKAFALIGRLSYTDGFAQNLIDVTLSPQHIISSQILSSMYRGEIVKTRSFMQGHNIVAEWRVSSDSIFIGQKVSSVHGLGAVRVIAVSNNDSIDFQCEDIIIEKDMLLLVMLPSTNSMKIMNALTGKPV